MKEKLVIMNEDFVSFDIAKKLKEKGLKLENTAWEIIPAWSLHRLLLLCDVTAMFTRDILETAYDDQINAIENIIKNGFFNKEYLKQ